MTDLTPLDRAHAAMEAASEDDATRLRFYDRLAAAELFLALEAEPQGDRIDPLIFPVEDNRLVLAFDREERLAAFFGQPSPYAALSGRSLAAMLAAEGLGLGLNLEVAPSAMILPAEAMDWLARTTAERPRSLEARPEEIGPPGALPEAVLTALDARLAAAEGMARHAWLVTARYQGAGRMPLLVFIDARPGAEEALAQTAQEALVFAGIEAGAMDVAFLAASDPMAATLARHGLRFDIPQPAAPQARPAPGSDPDRPPKLR